MKSRTRLILVLVLPLLCLGSKGLCSQEALTLGRDPIPSPRLVERHSQALIHWVKKGFRECSVIHIDAHDDLRCIPQGRINRLERICRDMDLQALREGESASDTGLYHAGSFLYAAGRLGIVKRIYWVIPFSYFSAPEPDAALRSFLRQYSFAPEDIRTFQLQSRTFSGRAHGLPLLLCPPKHLPEIREPLLVSLDADFFPALASESQAGLLAVWHSFLRTLFEKRYHVLDVIIAHSIDGGFLEPVKRWIGYQSRDVLQSPGLLTHPPPVWTLRDRVNTLYEQGRADGLMEACRSGLSRFPGEPSLTLYMAFALLARGEIEASFELAQGLCRMKAGYCPGLADLGQCLLDRGRLDAGLRFFEQAYAFNPDMNYRQTELALALRRAGCYQEALDYFESCRLRNGSFPTDFLLGETCLLLGKDDRALFHFNRGRERLSEILYPVVRDEYDARAIGSAIAFYERIGMRQAARSLQAHPDLKAVLQAYAPKRSGLDTSNELQPD